MITSEDIQLVAEMFGVSADKVRYALELARIREGTKMENRDIDALVAEKVMGYKWFRSVAGTKFGDGSILRDDKVRAWLIRPGGEWSSLIEDDGKYPKLIDTSGLPHYSTDISASWQVVEKLEELGYWAQLRTPFDKGAADSFYWCGFTPRLTTGWNGKPDHWTNAPTITMAICLAALKCVGVVRISPNQGMDV